MKKVFTALLLIVLAVSCAHQEKVSLVNPFSDLPSLERAEELAGFSITLPDLPEEYDQTLFRVMSAGEIKMLEIIFHTPHGDEVRIRKAHGSDDISGDYNTYDNISYEDGVTMKGNGESFSNATWFRDGYTYSIMLSDPVSSDVLLFFTKQVI